jgi:hypothetical protein
MIRRNLDYKNFDIISNIDNGVWQLKFLDTTELIVQLARSIPLLVAMSKGEYPSWLEGAIITQAEQFSIRSTEETSND